MKWMNLYFYAFYRLYKRLQLNQWGDGTYVVTMFTLIALEVWILHCLLGDVALLVGLEVISNRVMLFFTPASIVSASVFTYITIYRHFRGHHCILLFDSWPPGRHKIAGITVRLIAAVLIANSICLLQLSE